MRSPSVTRPWRVPTLSIILFCIRSLYVVDNGRSVGWKALWMARRLSRSSWSEDADFYSCSSHFFRTTQQHPRCMSCIALAIADICKYNCHRQINASFHADGVVNFGTYKCFRRSLVMYGACFYYYVRISNVTQVVCNIYGLLMRMC
jgi:hypothetical protein